MAIVASPYPPALVSVSGLELSAYDPDHIAERIRRALARENVRTVHALVRRLERDPAARRRFRRSVAVSMTGLFRDAHQFDLLDDEVLPGLVEAGRHIHVWSAGCADGSELFSVALLLQRRGALERARLLGSDVLEENLELARRARYRTDEGESVMSEELRACVRFELRDLVRDEAPPGAWQLVLCRNVAIYIEPTARRRLHGLLAAALAPGGTLLLGRSERIASPTELGLAPAGANAYRRVP